MISRGNPFGNTDHYKVTNDGKDGVIFNGIPDWVYEEDVLRTNNAIHISANAGKIAYARFDDSHVPEFQYTVYGDPFDVSKNKYPEYKKLRYPKAGEYNPTVKLYVAEKCSGLLIALIFSILKCLDWLFCLLLNYKNYLYILL